MSRVDNSLTRNASSRYIVVSAVHIRVKYLVSAELAVPIFRDITQQGENTTGFLSI